MFPISDEHGNPVAFGGRVLPDAKGPKYINTSSAAVIYDKSRVLYGLNEHRAEIVRKGQAVICEGYTDVIGAAVAGVDTAVATCGTALTEQHVQLLKRFSADRLILAFDADTAGKVAAERVYEWERKHELEVFVAALPDGSDPDDLAQTDPEALRRAVNEAMPFLQFRVDRVLAGHHMGTLENRGRAAATAAEVVGEHPDGMVRDNYLMSIADKCRVNIKLLRQAEEAARKRRRGSRRSATPGPAGSEAPTGRNFGSASSRAPAGRYPGRSGRHSDRSGRYPGRTGRHPDRSGRYPGRTGRHPDRGDAAWQDLKSGRSWQSAVVEDEAIRLLIHYPQQASAWLHRSLLADSTRREAFDALQEADSVIGAGEMVSEPAARLIHRLATDPGDVPATDVLARIAGLAAPRAMDELRRGAANSSADLRQEYIRCFTWLNKQVELLTESDTRDAALSVLMPWLIEHGRRTEAADRPPEIKQHNENPSAAAGGVADWDAAAAGAAADWDAAAAGGVADWDAAAAGAAADWDGVADWDAAAAGAAADWDVTSTDYGDVPPEIASSGEIALER